MKLSFGSEKASFWRAFEARSASLPVYHCHAARQLAEVGRLFKSGVAAPDYRQLLALEEEPVADGAVGDALPHEPHLRVKVQPARVGAARHDHAQGPSLLTRGPHDERVCPEVYLGHVVLDQLRAHPLSLRSHLLHQVGPHHRVLEAGIVLHIAGQHELAAVPRTHVYDGAEPRAGTVDRGRETGRTRTNNHYVADVFQRKDPLKETSGSP